MFNDANKCEPLKLHEVLNNCWGTIAVDLFGPMPSSKHIVVVQDLASRLPAAKLVASTKATHVLPAQGTYITRMGTQVTSCQVMHHR